MTRTKQWLGRLAVVAAVVLILSGLAADVTLARPQGQTGGNSNTHPTSQTGRGNN